MRVERKRSEIAQMSDLYRRCEVAFLESVATTIKAVVGRSPLANEEQKKALVENLVFAVAAHLSGSSHGGLVDEKQVYPKVVYSVGDDETGVTNYISGPSAMHEFAQAITRKLSST